MTVMLKQHIPQWIISVFLLMMFITAWYIALPMPALLSDTINRLLMNGILVLSLVPMLKVGAGINFGMSGGIIAGLLGMCLAVNAKLVGLGGFFSALGFAMLLGAFVGYGYGKIINRVKGKEEITGVFAGFSFIFIMDFFWAVAPFSNRAMLWPIGGQGLRPTISLQNYFGKVLNNLWVISVGDCTISLGMVSVCAGLCILVFLFFKTKMGLAMVAVGENEVVARLAGIDIEGMRILGVVLSMALAAMGICIYAQSYGFIELYEAPLLLAFPAASSILIGGAGHRQASIRQVILGTFLFQSLYVVTGPIANILLVPQVSEIIRMLITNGIILYALLHEGSLTRW